MDGVVGIISDTSLDANFFIRLEMLFTGGVVCEVFRDMISAFTEALRSELIDASIDDVLDLLEYSTSKCPLWLFGLRAPLSNKNLEFGSANTSALPAL